MLATSDEPDRLPNAPHPRETLALVGHAVRERTFLDALASGRMHHAWLLGGPEGIGKASFAYRAARFLLAAGDPQARATRSADLAMPEHDPATRRVMAQSHPDLHVLRRIPKPDGKSYTSNIPVDSIRRVIDRFGSSAAEGGWRVCIVDSAEDMERSAANALLKLLEEPPPRALFLIVAHAPGRMLPTIRSRCRLLTFEPLAETDVAEAGRLALERMEMPFDGSALRRAGSLSEGSVRRALTYVDPETLALVEAVRARLDALPQIDLAALMALAEDVAGKAGERDFAVMIETVQGWISDHLHAHAAAQPARLAPLAEVWEKLGQQAREVETYNLDRRPLVMTLFHDLSSAVSRSRAA
ncbi:MAG: DNA polymerase III subunit delta' [Bosea sp.]|uniref:DNA polymerase III subunit delta' n=1 Tax=Bosea sp. (in: a-proteobacteria) TaxID=1871050 RepID=UPI001ACA58DA|nr:DNA polymerase III subunit delta' [Bosea sp. (in: a-proteobacteria)]MBN9454936.1 DNA polymerase III subunit delta' [Bosea sp. (in: a-proteobacteria)]